MPAGGSDEAIAARWMASLTLRQKAAQLVVIPFSGHPMNVRSRDYRDIVRLVSQESVGGMILINVANRRLSAKPDPQEAAGFINKMQKLAKIPLIVSGDFERGASMRIDGTTGFPHAMAFTASRDPKEARLEGEITARESRAMGVHWIFFPDTDVNNNPENPIINIRSYGEEPRDVSAFASAFIEGAHSVPSARVLVTAKHFPGHGDTATDSHMNLATIPADRPRLEQLEWAPFRAAIAAGVDSIMSAHIAVPAIEAPDLPATLSGRLLHGVLRDELGFKGIVVTDALEMGGIAHGFSVGEAAVRALEAGADVLLMPPDPEVAINAVVSAVNSNRITRKRLEESVLRVLTAKAHLGLASNKLVVTEKIKDAVNTPAHAAAAQTIADRSVTLVRNNDSFLPLKAPAAAAFFVLAESRSGVQGQAFQEEVHRRAPSAPVFMLDPSLSAAEVQAAFERARTAQRYVVAAFASVAAFRGNVALGGNYAALLDNLVATKKPVMLVALGNPYLLRTFPGVTAYATTYSSVPVSEVAAVKALFGEIAVGGKLPVSIPGLAKHGEGIELAAETRR